MSCSNGSVALEGFISPSGVLLCFYNTCSNHLVITLQSGRLSMQGRYEILSLSGSFLPTDLGGGIRQRTGGLSVSLAGSDGRVIGGGVAGMLTAASPIQVSDIYLFLESRL